MKKNLAFLLAVVLAFTCVLGLGAAAAEAKAPVIYTTVPMRATVSILYAVKAAELDGAALYVQKNGGEAVALTNPKEEGEYLIFEYSNLSAAEMETKVKVYVEGYEADAKTYSVADFLNKYIAENENSANGKLAKAMLDYGAAVAEYKKPAAEN